MRVIAGDTLIAGALPWRGALRWQRRGALELPSCKLSFLDSVLVQTLRPTQRTLWGGICPKSRLPLITSTKDLWNWLCIILGSPHTITSQVIPLGIFSTELVWSFPFPGRIFGVRAIRHALCCGCNGGHGSHVKHSSVAARTESWPSHARV